MILALLETALEAVELRRHDRGKHADNPTPHRPTCGLKWHLDRYGGDQQQKGSDNA